MVVFCKMHGKMRNIKCWLENLRGKRSLGRPYHIWEYKVKIDAGEIGNED
jgi:hypothetical protein